MHKITTHQFPGSFNERLEIGAGEPGAAGARNEYLVKVPTLPEPTFFAINFQNGNPNVAVNGLTMECLLAIMAERLNGFQSGQHPCTENEKALSHIEMAMFYLQRREQRLLGIGVTA
jgi:hypothetical protein